MTKDKKIIIGIIAGAIVMCALVFLVAAKGFSNQGKYVEVKGLSERIVKADRAIWSINFEVKSNDSTDLFNQIKKNVGDVTTFLKSAGFEDSEISTAPASTYQDTYSGSQYRYNARVSMSVYTDKVDLVRTTSQNTLSLIEKGIVMNDNYISFEISDINAVKPEMLAEAIANARVSAQQFADDSGARVGDIARANQGVFTITDKDPGSPEYKNVRVVSTLRYLLH
ncbi:SIMPL domain-containing protein [Patescibacteria group bacterium]|nr:SIMPL domain-containing protein [Patescibacteria group bacterium]